MMQTDFISTIIDLIMSERGKEKRREVVVTIPTETVGSYNNEK